MNKKFEGFEFYIFILVFVIPAKAGIHELIFQTGEVGVGPNCKDGGWRAESW